ncbi:MAG: polyprenyl diphosphate synthase [bacterium]
MTLDKTRIPEHIAIIMDGNRRWAKSKVLPVVAGHGYVVDKVIEPLIERCGELGIKYLTLWAFSTENWSRDTKEVDGIMQLFKRALMEKVEGFVKKGARLRMIGDMSRFSPELQKGMQKAIETSSHNDKITVTFALNYGGRDEIVRAVRRYMSSEDCPTMRVEDAPSTFGVPTRDSLGSPVKERPQITGQALDLTEDVLSQYMDTAGMPDPELIIRTGGEQRLSGFMLWQSAYSEFYFTDKLMPEFTKEELEKALEDFQGRQRRFGK